ncbi:hypothetical protein JYU06_03675 [Desulfotalea psychrophila]|uniref:DUF8082 domain-containing protein n=1 Tax=Desulfotalea psychrophila TaxID=84980 RepID=A0ABS3AX66_9BACT|nr:hypothetical protein [Desulfotalea psychrophila]
MADRTKGTFFSSMPDYFTDSMVIEASNNLGRMMQMAAVKGLDPQSMSIRYDTFTVIAIPVDSEANLLILCEPGCNTSLMSTTANMLGPEIKKALEQASESDTKVSTSTPAKEEAEHNLFTQKTSQALISIKQALFDTVGPIADIVYNECVDRWTANHPPNVSRIFELVGCISTEIDNPELFAEFKEKISALL